MNIGNIITKPKITKVVDPSSTSLGDLAPNLPITNKLSQTITTTPISLRIEDISTLGQITINTLQQNINNIVESNKTNSSVVQYNSLLSQKFYDPSNYNLNIPPTEISYNQLTGLGRTVFRTVEDVRAPLLEILYEILQEASILTHVFDSIWQTKFSESKLGQYLDNAPTMLNYFFYKTRNNLNYFASMGNYINDLSSPIPALSYIPYLNGLFKNHSNKQESSSSNSFSLPEVVSIFKTTITDEVIHDSHDFEHYTQLATQHHQDIWNYIGLHYTLATSLSVSNGVYIQYLNLMKEIETPLLKDFNSQGELSIFRNSIERSFTRQAQQAEQHLLTLESNFQNMKEMNEARISLALKSRSNLAHTQFAEQHLHSLSQGLGGVL